MTIVRVSLHRDPTCAENEHADEHQRPSARFDQPSHTLLTHGRLDGRLENLDRLRAY